MVKQTADPCETTKKQKQKKSGYVADTYEVTTPLRLVQKLSYCKLTLSALITQTRNKTAAHEFKVANLFQGCAAQGCIE